MKRAHRGRGLGSTFGTRKNEEVFLSLFLEVQSPSVSPFRGPSEWFVGVQEALLWPVSFAGGAACPLYMAPLSLLTSYYTHIN